MWKFIASMQIGACVVHVNAKQSILMPTCGKYVCKSAHVNRAFINVISNLHTI